MKMVLMAVVVWMACLALAILAIGIWGENDAGEIVQPVVFQSTGSEGAGKAGLSMGLLDAVEDSVQREMEAVRAAGPGGGVCQGICKGYESESEGALIESALLEQGYFRNDIPLSYDLQDVLQTACERWNVPYALALAVIEKESGFQTDAVGVDGRDYGLFQIRESNHAWLREETGADPMTVYGNVECGVWFLAYLHGYCKGSWEAALTTWRWGPGHGTESTYSRAVLHAAERWK